MSAIDIGHELAINGYEGETNAFFDIVSGIWWEGGYYQKYNTVENLLYHCTEAKKFCDSIRMVAAVNLSDFVILKTLNNLRKNKYLATYKELE